MAGGVLENRDFEKITASSIILVSCLGKTKLSENITGAECHCGKSWKSASGGSRIVGGKAAKGSDYPWQAKIVTSDKSHLCGGTIISKWVGFLIFLKIFPEHFSGNIFFLLLTVSWKDIIL